MCLMLCINIYLYNKEDLTYNLYWKFETNEEPTEIIYMLFINNNHFELLYKKNHIFKYKKNNEDNVNKDFKNNVKDKFKQINRVMKDRINKKPNCKILLNSIKENKKIGKGLYVIMIETITHKSIMI